MRSFGFKQLLFLIFIFIFLFGDFYKLKKKIIEVYNNLIEFFKKNRKKGT